MKKLLLILALTLSLNAGVAGDKFMHAGAGFVIYVGCLVATDVLHRSKENVWMCLIPVAVAGVGKEVYDHNHPDNHTAEWQDAAATMLIPLAFTVTLYKW